MANLMSWFLRGQCLRHAEPMFDRDATGAIFRCPRCMHTWPRFQSAAAVGSTPVPGATPVPGTVRIRRPNAKENPLVRRPNVVATLGMVRGTI
jgi:hypothetical protein